ncbi:MAG TPA: hypothetical protein VF463_03670 [Sphingobium sp.]
MGIAFLISLPLVIQASPLILVRTLVIAVALAAVLGWLIAGVLHKGHFHRIWLKFAVVITFLLTAISASPIYYTACWHQRSSPNRAAGFI